MVCARIGWLRRMPGSDFQGETARVKHLLSVVGETLKPKYSLLD